MYSGLLNVTYFYCLKNNNMLSFNTDLIRSELMGKEFFESNSETFKNISICSKVITNKDNLKGVKGNPTDLFLSITYGLSGYLSTLILAVLMFLIFTDRSTNATIFIITSIHLTITILQIYVFRKKWREHTYKETFFDRWVTKYGLVSIYYRFNNLFKSKMLLRKLKKELKQNNISLEDLFNSPDTYYYRISYILCHLNEPRYIKKYPIFAEVNHTGYIDIFKRIVNIVDSTEESKDKSLVIDCYKLLSESVYDSTTDVAKAIHYKDVEFIDKYSDLYRKLPKNFLYIITKTFYNTYKGNTNVTVNSLVDLFENFEAKFNLPIENLIEILREIESLKTSSIITSNNKIVKIEATF